MADAVFEVRIELAEGLVEADRLKHRVVAEAFVAARRPDEGAVDAAVERLDLSVVGPGDRQRADEMRGGSSVRLRRLDRAPDLLHRPHPVAVAVLILGPAGRKDSGSPMQRVDAQAA